MTPEEQRLKKNQESLESYNWYKAHHVCVRCRNASATDGFVTCPKCREAINAGHRFWYAALTPERKKKGQAKTKAIRAKWREQGRCTRCGREREDPNLLTCERCRRGDREGCLAAAQSPTGQASGGFWQSIEARSGRV